MRRGCQWSTFTGAGTIAAFRRRAIWKWPSYVRGVLRQGYRGPLSLEIFNDRFREWSASQIAVDGLRSLILLKDQVKVPPALLPRIAILGVDFIEFAVHGDEVAALGSLLATLGFTQVGTHRTKKVTLWRQGAVHLVLNSDETGWAREHWQIHGASVCAIALRVANARAALDRAASLNIGTFVQGSGGRRTRDPLDSWCRWRIDLFYRTRSRRRTLDPRFSADGYGPAWAHARIRARGLFLADHAHRGVPVVAASLHLPVRRCEDAHGRGSRYLRTGSNPGDRVAGREFPGAPGRLSGGRQPRLALHRRRQGSRRSAHCARDPRYLQRRRSGLDVGTRGFACPAELL